MAEPPNFGVGSDARMIRGLELSKTATISETEDGAFAVPSLTTPNVVYEVRIIGETIVCDCPDYLNRAHEIDRCKHGQALSFWLAARVEIQEKPKPKVFSDDSIQCVRCGSIRVIRFGTRKTKQTYRCNDCACRFTPSLIKKARYSPETVTLTLDLYFSGMSFAKIARSLNDNYDMNIGATSIYRWAKRYVPMISEYVNSLAPQLSDTWHADELFVKMKGGETAKGGMDRKTMKNMAYLWNIMDRKTRFLIASRLSEKRDSIAVIGAFNRAMRVAHGSEPETVLTDGYSGYIDGIRRTLGREVKHTAKVGIKKPHANNNRIERLNGTLRERAKVQRGWKSMETPIPDGQRIQYNFVKPHMALEGQTPAEAAGIGIAFKNKWMGLLEQAIARKDVNPSERQDKE